MKNTRTCRTSRPAIVAALCFFSVAIVGPRTVLATPFAPTDDNQILERLPVSPLDPGARQLREMRRELSAQPDNLVLATGTAWRDIEQGRAASDPRYWGYAEAALAPWWHQADPPTAVLVLRATIRQHDHDFDGALADLAVALQADPHNAQAWLTRALIFQARGDYDNAKHSCEQVLQLATPLVAMTCASGVESLSGSAAQSYEVLRGALVRAIAPDAGVRVWALTVLAETAARLGRSAAAEQHFTDARALGVRDEYLLGAYADFLLDENRPQAVVSLLADETRADALLLRLVIAEQRIGSPTADPHLEELRARFAAAHLRGDTVHRREEARFALQCLQQPRQALDLARANWQVQREPWDARILLAAAVAAGDPAGARPVVEFLAQTKLEDVQLAHLTETLRGQRQ